MDPSRKLEKLDNAFLFTLSSVAIIISFIQASMKSAVAIVEAIPFLILGIAFPFYIGYLRGSIDLDVTAERVRGWIYFLIGTGSNFSFIALLRIETSFAYREVLFYSLLIFSVVFTYIFIKWTKRVYNITSIAAQYSFSATVVCGIAASFLIREIVALYTDYQGRNFMNSITSTISPEFWFWLQVLVLAFSVLVIGEKASREVLDKDLVLPKAKRRIGTKILSLMPFRALFLGSKLFERAFGICLKAQVLWIEGFAFWTIGAFLWVVRIPVISSILMIVAITCTLLGILFFLRHTHIHPIDFGGIENQSVDTTSTLLIVFVITVIAVFSNSIWVSVLLVLYLVSQLFPDRSPK
jgi:hypothetical protein